MPRRGQKRRRKSSLRFSSRKQFMRSRMKLRSGSTQEPAEVDTQRVLDYGNIVSERELESIQETEYETPRQSKQPEICEEGSDSDEESQDVEVIIDAFDVKSLIKLYTIHFNL
jgi:hypothetical protein